MRVLADAGVTRLGLEFMKLVCSAGFAESWTKEVQCKAKSQNPRHIKSSHETASDRGET